MSSLCLWRPPSSFMALVGSVDYKVTTFGELSLISNHFGWRHSNACQGPWASIHSADERITTRSREVSKPRDSYLNFSNLPIIDRHIGSIAAEMPVKFQSVCDFNVCDNCGIWQWTTLGWGYPIATPLQSCRLYLLISSQVDQQSNFIFLLTITNRHSYA